MWESILLTVAATSGNNIGEVLQKKGTLILPPFSFKLKLLIYPCCGKVLVEMIVPHQNLNLIYQVLLLIYHHQVNQGLEMIHHPLQKVSVGSQESKRVTCRHPASVVPGMIHRGLGFIRLHLNPS